ncbi:NAD(P)/FAD-dependent oxidoreductase [Streptomyces sp. DSM 44917]|uniref:NAD(P)/FAD-dependent oxidoreductase n=1 Tax=Streptomyces boetiae TaxID=3075541 RepID=A0ABU2L1B9_9ACTN|nr:NAD(P)/FAD-dependent oxidoreductase [Streptomyces sp. DSM 44917]MDT0305359.1 NAD(P)/FAD-dependent oxidoreductase [Streptomyces sp. DSM 44917]
MPAPPPVHVVGAGPGGLAAAAALAQRGLRAVVLERAPDVGGAWRGHYDRLRLHTTRRGSALPGLAIPRSAGRWVGRDEFVRYLESYARRHRIELAAGVTVARVDPAGDAPGDWLLRANGGRELRARAVVVATGRNHTPHLPDWPGAAAWDGELLHAADYRSPARFAGRDVLVVGAGNSGADIAADLAAGGAGRVRLAVRTAPHILRKTILGWPYQRGATLVGRLPAPVADRLAAPAARLIPDLAAHGLPRPEGGLYTRLRQGRFPVLDDGLVRAVRRGEVEPVPAVVAFEGGKVLLADGEAIGPEVVIAATGYRTGLEPLVGHLGVLDASGLPPAAGRRAHPAAPGLHFTGFGTPPGGTLHRLGREAGRIAAAISATQRERPRRARAARPSRRDRRGSRPGAAE